MNVFDAIYINDLDSIEREFVSIETAFEIAVAKAHKDFDLEYGLLTMNSDGVITEAAASKTASKSFIGRIVEAISDLFNGIINAISSIFGGKSEKDLGDRANDTIQLNTDMDKMSSIVDDEIGKGHNLLRKIVSPTGASDEEVDEYINKGKKRIKGIAGAALTLAAAFGLTKLLKTSTKNKDKAVSDAAKIVEGGSTDPKRESQIRKIFSHISSMAHEFTSSVKSFGSDINREFNETKQKLKNEYNEKHKNVSSDYGKLSDKYKNSDIDDDEYLSKLRATSEEEKAITDEHRRKVAEAKSQRDQNLQAKSIYEGVLKKLNKQIKGKKITNEKLKGLSDLAYSKYQKYTKGTLDFKTYESEIRALLKTIV